MNIRAFRPEDQQAVFDLVMQGLGQRFDDLKPEYNPDLYDIQAAYMGKSASFLVIEVHDAIIACGALTKENGSDLVARIERVSVRADQQGQGLGRIISEKLIDVARERGFEKVLVETNDDWTSALRLYRACGFTETHRVQPDGCDWVEVHMEMQLSTGTRA